MIFEILQNIDNAIMLWLNKMQNPVLLNVARGISFLGNNGAFWLVMGLAMVLCVKRHPRIGRWGIVLLAALAVTAIAVNLTIKPLAARIRPYDALGLSIMIEKPHDFSFPSGHTAAAFASAVVFIAMNKRTGIYMLVFAVCMAASRLYLLVHYPTDVIAGAAIGSVLAFAVVKAFKRYYKGFD